MKACLQSAIDQAVEIEMQKKIDESNKTIEQAIKDLAEALQDQKRIKELWPDAPAAHEVDLFSHMKFKFDLNNG